MIKKFNINIKAYLDSKIFWLITAFVVACILWANTSGADAEEIKITLTNVPVEIIGEDSLKERRNLVLTDINPQTVTVEITGPRRQVTNLNAADFSAQINVSKLTQSTYTSLPYNVSFPDGINLSNLTVTSQTPDTIDFAVSKYITKAIQVRGSFDGIIEEGYSAENYKFDPEYITVSGPANYIDKVSYAWVSFGAEKVSDSFSVETGFVLKDSDNNDYSSEYITTSDDTVVATLSLLKEKTVTISVDLIDGAGATSDITKVTVEPESITIAGDSAIISKINTISLGTIDLGDFVSEYTSKYTIPLPDEVKNLTGITEATVKVEIVGTSVRNYTVSNISVINVTDGYECDIVTENINVTLRGPAEILNQLSSDDIHVVADINDYKESVGSFQPKVDVYIDGYNNAKTVGAMGQNTITIVLRKAAEAPTAEIPEE